MLDQDCIFCQIAHHGAKANIVYDDDMMMAFHDIHPKAPVHLLAIPKIHIRNLYDQIDQHNDVIIHLMQKIPQIAQQAGLVNGFRLITNTGPGGRQEVQHLHFHILGGGRLPAM